MNDALSATDLDALEREVLRQRGGDDLDIDLDLYVKAGEILAVIRRLREAGAEIVTWKEKHAEAWDHAVIEAGEVNRLQQTVGHLERLVRKYIAHLNYEEGSSFLGERRYNPRLFTEEEWAELESLARESERDYPLRYPDGPTAKVDDGE